MLQRKFFHALAVFAIVTTVIGTTSIIADALGLSVTTQAFACHSESSSGGNC